MKTINQSVEISFSAIEFKDALIILPIMDELVNNINTKQKSIDEYKSKQEINKQEPYYIKEYREEIPVLLKRYNILSKIGFVSSIDLLPSVKLS